MFFFFAVHPSQSSSGSGSNNDDAFDNFSNAFDDLDKQDKVHSAIDEGFHRWENGSDFDFYFDPVATVNIRDGTGPGPSP